MGRKQFSESERRTNQIPGGVDPLAETDKRIQHKNSAGETFIFILAAGADEKRDRNMFERFGEMTGEEINVLAENLFNEGDQESIQELAKENGIPEEFAELYLEGEIPELCDPLTAALGKIDLEVKELKPKEIMEDWVEYLRGQCMEEESMALAVRTKGKSLKGCIAELLKWSFDHQQQIDKDIVKAAGVNAGRVTLGIPGMGTAKRIIKNYYLGEKK